MNAMFFPKGRVYKSEKWLRAVAALETCSLCGSSPVQAAHRNEGKGMSQKTSDCLTAALCLACHHDIDNGAEFDRRERRARLDRATVITVERLALAGRLVIT